MYYPVQIPNVLNKNFSESICYFEEIIPLFKDFVICFWEMQAKTSEIKTIDNIIITDGCIDLVADYAEKQIGFAGMSKTEFHYKMKLPSQSFGARFKPGAFYALTGISASEVMNAFLPISAVDKNFDAEQFFELPFNEAKGFFKSYVGKLIKNKTAGEFVSLFDRFYDEIPESAESLYKTLHFSSRQCQRHFIKNFGLSPQMVLCILRFQKCLRILTSGKASPNDILNLANYYDQAHLIKDFKKHIGLTPFELIELF